MSDLTPDRQQLWWLENFLAVNGTTPTQHDRRLALRDYLHRTCEHSWSDVSGWGGCPKGTKQCDWCNWVLSPGEKPPTPPNSVARDVESSTERTSA